MTEKDKKKQGKYSNQLEVIIDELKSLKDRVNSTESRIFNLSLKVVNLKHNSMENNK